MSQGVLKTYDASELSVIVGSRALRGFAPDTFVTIERDEQSWTKQVGADGEVTRSKTNNKAGMVTIQLQQASDDNEYLSALLASDELTGAGTVPLIIRDAKGSSLYASEQVWIQKPPTVEYGRDGGVREWVLDCANLEMFIGKN